MSSVSNVLTIFSSFKRKKYDLGDSDPAARVVENWDKWKIDKTRFKYIREIIADLQQIGTDESFNAMHTVCYVVHNYEIDQRVTNFARLYVLAKSALSATKDTNTRIYRWWLARTESYQKEFQLDFEDGKLTKQQIIDAGLV